MHLAKYFLKKPKWDQISKYFFKALFKKYLLHAKISNNFLKVHFLCTAPKLVSKNGPMANNQKLGSPNVKCMSIHGYMHSARCFCSFCSKMQIFQASVNVWPVSKVAIVRCLVIAGVTALDVPIDALVIMPTLTDAIQSMESVFANMVGKVSLYYHNLFSFQ